MKKLRVLWRIMKQTGADRILAGFVLFLFICAAIVWIFDPQIATYRDALWYCYAVITTIGFGDVLATSPISRIVSVILSVYAALVLAIVTGVIVNFYMQVVEMRQSETITSLLDRLEHLPEMSRDELEKLSGDIKNLRNKR